MYSKLKEHGLPGDLGVLAQYPVGQGHKVEQEVSLVVCLVLVAQQIHKTVKVRLLI